MVVGATGAQLKSRDSQEQSMYRITGSTALLALTVCLSNSGLACGAGLPATRPAVVVELFTAEGCSSCHPADALLGELAKQGAIDGVEIIPLEMHVDYWNRLGWVDPFSSPDFSARQQGYARLANSAEIYTPQMIVNGTDGFVGSDRQRAVAAIRRAAAHAKGTMALEIDSGDGKAVTCNLAIGPIEAIGAT